MNSYRKRQVTIVAAVVGLWLASAQAASPDGFLGTWELDISKTPLPADPSAAVPKSVTVTIKDAGGGKRTNQVVIVSADGKKVEQTPVTYGIEGSTSLTGNPQADSMTMTHPDASTEIVTNYKAGKQVQRSTAKLSVDGKQDVITIDSVDKNGKPVQQILIFNRK